MAAVFNSAQVFYYFILQAAHWVVFFLLFCLGNVYFKMKYETCEVNIKIFFFFGQQAVIVVKGVT